jgi:dipeptidyl aminopeptidase/acylaminoacyl peptidase
MLESIVKMPIKTIMLRLGGALLIFYVVLFAMQRYLVFPAYMADLTLGKLKSPTDYGLADFTEVYFSAEDGVPIMGWSHPPEKNMPDILYLHGNGMHIAGHAQRYQAFAEAGYGVLALSWRG